MGLSGGLATNGGGGPWSVLTIISGQMTALAAGTRVFGAGLGPTLVSNAGAAACAFYLDPSMGGAVRMFGWVTANATDPAAGAFTIGLYPVTGFDGATNTDPTITGLGSAVASVSVTPVVSSAVVVASGYVPFPAAGFYVAGVVTTGATAASSIERIGMSLVV